MAESDYQFRGAVSVLHCCNSAVCNAWVRNCWCVLHNAEVCCVCIFWRMCDLQSIGVKTPSWRHCQITMYTSRNFQVCAVYDGYTSAIFTRHVPTWNIISCFGWAGDCNGLWRCWNIVCCFAETAACATIGIHGYSVINCLELRIKCGFAGIYPLLVWVSVAAYAFLQFAVCANNFEAASCCSKPTFEFITRFGWALDAWEFKCWFISCRNACRAARATVIGVIQSDWICFRLPHSIEC